MSTALTDAALQTVLQSYLTLLKTHPPAEVMMREISRDYGAAAIGGDGSIWLASEYIGPRPRTALANWGTFITRLSPDDDDHHHHDGKHDGD
jgi:hypothetical protein